MDFLGYLDLLLELVIKYTVEGRCESMSWLYKEIIISRYDGTYQLAILIWLSRNLGFCGP